MTRPLSGGREGRSAAQGAARRSVAATKAAGGKLHPRAAAPATARRDVHGCCGVCRRRRRPGLSVLLSIALSTARGRAAGASDDPWGSAGVDNPQYWDQVYRFQGAHGRRTYEWYGLGFPELEASLEVHLPPRGASVLVVGSGDSTMSTDLAASGWSVTSIDFSAEVTSRMKQAYPELTFLTMDARSTTFGDASFDAVFDKGLSDCIGTAEERRAYFGELRRVLRPAGTLAVVAQRPLAMPEDVGEGWRCRPLEEHYGPLFFEDSAARPPMPTPGTEGSIPYYLLGCQKSGAEDDEAR